MRYDNYIKIRKRTISLNEPTYFIADIASNHDGDLHRAVDLIWLAKEACADAVKFQHFQASKIVSDFGFKHLGGQIAHQSTWKKTVYEVYQQYECKLEWTSKLIETAQKADIHFFTTPYDFDVVANIQLPAYKVGSGDITWIDFIEKISQEGKPVILSSGASTLEDVERAIDAVLKYNRQIALMQCNTNYTGLKENFRYINLNVLRSYAIHFPQMLLGLSDHSPGCSTVLGAIALGARLIEKHFTDNKQREGPDHSFSMDKKDWIEMVERCRELEIALGDGIKRVEANELDTVVVQRRCLRCNRDMQAGEEIKLEDLDVLRPAPANSLQPFQIEYVLGKRLRKSKESGDALYPSDLEESSC